MAKRYQRGNQVIRSPKVNQNPVNQRRTDNTMAKRYQRGNQKP